MPPTPFADWLKENNKTADTYTGLDFRAWVQSPTVGPLVEKYKAKTPALGFMQATYEQLTGQLKTLVNNVAANRAEILEYCESLVDVLSTAESILGKAEKEEVDPLDEKWSERVALDQVAPVPTVFYRKMSAGEFGACTADVSKIRGNFRFQKAFDYTPTAHYRYWMSSSLQKVQKFENEKASDTAGVIVKFTFSHGLAKTFGHMLEPHQKPGVQHDRTVVAFHREGFAQRGNLTDPEEMKKLIDDLKNYNLGFTSGQCVQLQSLLTKTEQL